MTKRRNNTKIFNSTISRRNKFETRGRVGRFLILILIASLFAILSGVGNVQSSISYDDFDNGSLDAAWSSSTDSGISFSETGGVAKFTQSSGGSSWDYGYIERSVLKAPGFKIYSDVNFDFRSLSYDGIGHAQLQILNAAKDKTVLAMRIRDYQASSTAYEVRIFGYDSSGTKIYDNAYGYETSQLGSGYFEVEWIDSDSVRITVDHPDDTYTTTINGVNSDVGYVRLQAGVHATYSGSHTYVEFDNYEESYHETFDDSSLDSTWSLSEDSGIDFAETGGAATFTQTSGGSSWDYGYIERPIERANGMKVQTDVEFDFRSLSYDGIGQAQIQILNSAKDKTVLTMRMRDYQASSTAYEVRVFGYDSSGTKIYDNALGYETSQLGSGFFQVIWEDADSVRVTVNHPDGLFTTTIDGVNSDVGYVRLSGGVHASYSGSHTFIKFDNFKEDIVPYYDDNDFARTDQNTDTEDVTEEIFEYAVTNYPGDFSGSINTDVEKIIAIEHFAEDILAYFWGSDNDALTAGEVAEELANFDGATDDKDSFSLVSRSTFDCRDMAAFISGVAFVSGLTSRMVSVSDVTTNMFIDDYQHFFTEIYGLDVNGNAGWYLIDPARDSSGTYYNSYTSDSTVQTGYGGSDQQLSRIWISSGWTSYGWGISASASQTGWLFQYYSPDPAPPSYASYTNNPWGL